MKKPDPLTLDKQSCNEGHEGEVQQNGVVGSVMPETCSLVSCRIIEEVWGSFICGALITLGHYELPIAGLSGAGLLFLMVGEGGLTLHTS